MKSFSSWTRHNNTYIIQYMCVCMCGCMCVYVWRQFKEWIWLKHEDSSTHFHSFLHVFAVILFNVMVRTNWKFQFISYDHSRPLSASSSNEHHYASTSIWIGTLKSWPKFFSSVQVKGSVVAKLLTTNLQTKQLDGNCANNQHYIYIIFILYYIIISEWNI